MCVCKILENRKARLTGLINIISATTRLKYPPYVYTEHVKPQYIILVFIPI